MQIKLSLFPNAVDNIYTQCHMIDRNAVVLVGVCWNSFSALLSIFALLVLLFAACTVVCMMAPCLKL